MARTCTVCTHADRLTIEKLLVEGVSYRDIARQYGVSFHAVGRHKTDHFPQLLADSRPLDLVAKQPGNRDTVAKQTATIETYIESRADDNHQHAIDVIRTTARQVEHLELLSNAVSEWLRDPEEPSRYSIDPRAGEIMVVYEDFADCTERGLPRKKRARLSQLLAHIADGSQGMVRPLSGETKHADPRKLLTGVADSLKGQMQLSKQLLEALYGAEQVQLFQDTVLEAVAEVDPDVRDRIERAIRGRLTHLRAAGPTLR
jgi:hypothetical protein